MKVESKGTNWVEKKDEDELENVFRLAVTRVDQRLGLCVAIESAPLWLAVAEGV